jgi:hypothetical protein
VIKSRHRAVLDGLLRVRLFLIDLSRNPFGQGLIYPILPPGEPGPRRKGAASWIDFADVM